jgi:hypothetical protein
VTPLITLSLSHRKNSFFAGVGRFAMRDKRGDSRIGLSRPRAFLVGSASRYVPAGNRKRQRKPTSTPTDELGRLRQERAEWQRRVKLLQSSSIDPDTLDEQARAVLNYLDPRDLTLMLKRP